MKIILIPYLITNGMVAYGNTIFVKTLGMFMQGVLHLRITLSYTNMYELVREGDKPFCAQLINIADTMAMAMTGLILMLTRNGVAFIQYMHIISTVFVLLYFLVIPESPRWLLINGKLKEGIDALNYIAKFNGSNHRIPQTAEFDIIGQLIKQGQALDNVSVGVLRAHETSSVISLAYHI